MISAVRIWLARRRLQRLVDRNRVSYEAQRYRERRAAALKHYRREAVQ